MDGGRRIDQDGMALRTPGQKQRRAQRISIRCRQRDIVDKYVVQPRLGHRRLPSGFESGHSKCEFGFCRKGLTKLQEIWLAVRRHPVYNPALH
jgi:hypothetical protein